MTLVATKLPLNCEADYYPDFMSKADSDALFRSIHSGYSLSPRIFKTATGEAQYDNYGGRWGDQSRLEQFLQAYAVEQTKIEARRKGHSVSEQSLADGSIKLTVQVGGAV